MTPYLTPHLSVADAAFHVVHDYPGGAQALSLRLGKSLNQLSDEVNPGRLGAKLGLVDAVKAQMLARDFRVLYAMAQDLGHFPPVPMPPQLVEGDCPTLQLVGGLAREFGELMAEVSGSLGDGQISDTELRRVTQAWGELVQAGQAVLGQLQALNDGAKPKEAR